MHMRDPEVVEWVWSADQSEQREGWGGGHTECQASAHQSRL
uniref:Uncharacterized protein n=1 Tax=Anguilla anguilla TaxID=7936 RepID=A0A0E9P7B6_ANGAN